MANTLQLSAHLATARLRDRRGTGALDVFAVAAFGVTAWLAFVVASGTWMFVQRRADPPSWVLGLESPLDRADLTNAHVVLAAIACAVLVLPILGLGGAAARLGARGRARRLAALRLVGMTSGEVVGMSVVESLVQAAVGLVLGALLWLVTLPLLGFLSFQRTPIAAHELVMPWWLWLTVAGTILLLAAASTALGLTLVRISPLGVARQVTKPALRAWRALALAVGVVAMLALGPLLQVPLGSMVLGLLFAGFIAVAAAMTNLFAPWLLQAVARIGVHTGSPARLLAMRRIAADPRSAWRNVSSLGLIGFIVGLLSTLPIDGGAFVGMEESSYVLMNDTRSGAWLTLGIALVVGAASTALAQGSDVVDRADELVALDRMGVSPQIDAAARRHQVVLPLVVTLLTSMGLGVLASVATVSALPNALEMGLTSAIVLGGCLAVALALTLVAAETTRPLRTRALGTLVRRND